MPRDSVRLIDVDFAAPMPPIRALHGINFGPRYEQTGDLSDRFRAAGFPSFRLHDCPFVCRDTVDIHSLFPLQHLDERDPANWIFGPTDDYISAIKALGGDIIFRLGPTIEHQQPKYFIHPPADFDKWARICCGIIRHYNEGWANGFHHGIVHWEIWNEPWHPAMWTGTPEQYYRLYEVSSKAIRKEFGHLKIGGADTLDREYAGNFLAHCRKHDCPMDFFCWHLYARTPKEIVDSARDAKRLVEDYGYGRAELNLNEWNWFPEEDWGWMMGDPDRTRRFHERISSAASAAFAAASLSFLQDEQMDMANWYAPFMGRWGMFDVFGRPMKPYYAFVAFNSMLQTPRRVKAVGGNLDAGLAVLAGLDPEQRSARVLISNFADPAASRVRLTLRNLPQGSWRGEVLLLDDAMDLQPVEVCRVDGSQAEMTISAGPASVRLLTLQSEGRR